MQPNALIPAFLARGNVKGLDVSPPIDDFTAAAYGLTPVRLEAIRAAGFDTLRFFLPTDEFLRPPISLAATTERWIEHTAKIVDSGFRCFIAWGVLLEDAIAVVTEPGPREAWLAALNSVAGALNDRFASADVALEMLNEPPGEEQAPGIYREANPLWFRTCRAVAADLTLIFQGEVGYYHQLKYFDLDQFDDNTMFCFHPYGPGEFTHQGINGQPLLYNVPYPITRYVGGQAKMVADMTARVNASDLAPAQKASEIARYSNILLFIWSADGTFWEDWSEFQGWIAEVGIDPRRIIAGEFGIVSQFNFNGTEALPDVASRAHWLRKLRRQCDENGYGGWVAHQAMGDFNLFEQTDVVRHGDRLIPELVKALLTDEPLAEGPPIEIVPVPAIRYLTDIFAAEDILAEFDFSDLRLMFQDFDATQPVTAAGEPVARVRNRYGSQWLMAASDSERVTLHQAGQAWALDFSAGNFSLHSSGFDAGAYLAAAIEFPTQWAWHTPIQAMNQADRNMLVSEGDTGRYRTSRSGSLETGFSTDPNDITINGVSDGTFVQHVPHVLGAVRSSADIPDGLCLGSNGRLRDHFSGLIFAVVLLARVPSPLQRRQLDRYLAGKAGLDEQFQPIVVPVRPPAGTHGVALAGMEFNGQAIPGTVNHDYFPPAAEDYAYFAAKGAKAIRFPLLAERLQPQLYGPLDEVHLGYVDQAIEHCRQHHMSLLLDIHNYGHRVVDGQVHSIGSDTVPVSAHADLMGKLASRYKDETAVYGYDIMNEPSEMPVLCTSATYHPNRSVVQLAPNPELANDENEWYLSHPWVRAEAYGREGSFGMGFHTNSGQWGQARYKHWTEAGLLCKANTTYLYSFYYRMELSVGEITAEMSAGANPGEAGNVALLADRLEPNAEWTRYCGVFQTGAEDTRLFFSVRADGVVGNGACTGFNITEGADPQPYVAFVASGQVATTTLMNQAAIDAIRSAGSQQWILIEGDYFSGLQSFVTNYGNDPEQWWHDPLDRTQLSFHYYQDADHSGRYQSPWTAELRERISADVAAAFRWCTAHGVVINIGEYGVNDEAEQLIDEATFLRLCEEVGAHTFAWAGGRAYTSQTSIQPLDNYTRDRASMNVVAAHLARGAIRKAG